MHRGIVTVVVIGCDGELWAELTEEMESAPENVRLCTFRIAFNECRLLIQLRCDLIERPDRQLVGSSLSVRDRATSTGVRCFLEEICASGSASQQAIQDHWTLLPASLKKGLDERAHGSRRLNCNYPFTLVRHNCRKCPFASPDIEHNVISINRCLPEKILMRMVRQ